jgi:hypothetical protein
MRESRMYGSGRGACDEPHVPTATTARVHRGARERGGAAAGGARAAADQSPPFGLADRPIGRRSRSRSTTLGFTTRSPRPGWTQENLRIDTRFTAGDSELTRTYVAELISLKPDIIAAHTTIAAATALELPGCTAGSSGERTVNVCNSLDCDDLEHLQNKKPRPRRRPGLSFRSYAPALCRKRA